MLIEGLSPIPSLGVELVAAARARGREIQASSLGLEDLQIAVGCAETTVECLRVIGQSVQAGGLLVVSVRKTGDDQAEAALRLFDVAAGADRSRLTVLLPLDAVARRTTIARATAVLFEPRAEDEQQEIAVGTLLVAAAQQFVEVTVNGQPRGGLPLLLRDVPVGRYEIEARLPGHYDWTGTAAVSAGKTTRLQIDLVPTRRPEHPPAFLDSIQLPTWVVASVGLVSLATGSIFGAHMVSVQNGYDSNPGETLQDIRHMQALERDGERDAVVANVMFGIGGAALVSAGIMAYLDFRGSRRSAADDGPASSPGATTKPSSSSPSSKTSLLVGPTSVRLGVAF